MAAPPPPQVSIHITNHNPQNPPIYTTNSLISGHALITSPSSIRCRSAEVVLVGLAGTRLELARHRPAQPPAPFLKMYMTGGGRPDHDADDCPGGGGLSDGDLDGPSFPCAMPARTALAVPFRFLVPAFLLETSCRHRASAAVRERHARLPPSLGGDDDDTRNNTASKHELLGRGRIQYFIETRLRYSPDSPESSDSSSPSFTVTGRQMVTILPALPELPPLLMDYSPPLCGTNSASTSTSRSSGKNSSRGSGSAYSQSSSLVVRRSLLRRRAGRLAASSAQPPAMMLDPSGRSSPCSVLRLQLRFTPSSSSPSCPSGDAPPPHKVVVSGIARGTTHLCAEPSGLLPGQAGEDSGTVRYRSAQTLLPPTTVTPEWTRHGAGDDDGEVRYVAELTMPLGLPAKQRRPVLPTFDSCLISQTYALEVRLSLGPATPRLGLTLPLQIGVCGGDF